MPRGKTISKAVNPALSTVLSTILTFHAVCVGWVFFRSESIASAGSILSKMFMLDGVRSGSSALAMVLPNINYPLIYPSIFLLLPLLAVAHVVMGYIDKTNWVARSPRLVKAAFCFVLMFAVMVFSPDKSPRFIYFQF